MAEESLRIIGEAIEELKAAIENSPDNLELRNLLMGTYQKEIDLLRKMAAAGSD